MHFNKPVMSEVEWLSANGFYRFERQWV